MFENYFTQLDRKVLAKSRKIFLFIDQCPPHMKITAFFSNIKVAFLPAAHTTQPQPLDLRIIHTFKCHYRKQLLQKTVAMIDGGLLENAVCMKLDMSSAVHFIAQAWGFLAPQQ
jgi:hypothetical protein